MSAPIHLPLSSLSPPSVTLTVTPPPLAAPTHSLDAAKVQQYLTRQKRRHQSRTTGEHFGSRLERSIYSVIQTSVYNMQLDGELVLPPSRSPSKTPKRSPSPSPLLTPSSSSTGQVGRIAQSLNSDVDATQSTKAIIGSTSPESLLSA